MGVTASTRKARAKLAPAADAELLVHRSKLFRDGFRGDAALASDGCVRKTLEHELDDRAFGSGQGACCRRIEASSIGTLNRMRRSPIRVMRALPFGAWGIRTFPSAQGVGCERVWGKRVPEISSTSGAEFPTDLSSGRRTGQLRDGPPESRRVVQPLEDRLS